MSAITLLKKKLFNATILYQRKDLVKSFLLIWVLIGVPSKSTQSARTSSNFTPKTEVSTLVFRRLNVRLTALTDSVQNCLLFVRSYFSLVVKLCRKSTLRSLTTLLCLNCVEKVHSEVLGLTALSQSSEFLNQGMNN